MSLTTRIPHRMPDLQEAQRFLNRLPVRLLSLVARVRPDERRDAGAAFLTLFGFMTGHALLETARDALFLGSLPARQLPWVYLAIALAALLLGQREPPLVRRFSTRNELSGWLTFSAAVTLVFWGVMGWTGPWIYFALYTWSGVLATLVVVRFWTLLAGLFTVLQAKRLFALIGVGSVAGAILGSGLARILAVWLPARHLVLAAALVFFVSSVAPTLLGRGMEVRPKVAGLDRVLDLGRVGQIVWARPYLRKVAALILAATLTLTLVDFVFKLTVDRYVPTEDMGAFFSTVYLVLNLLSLVVQVFLVSFLLRKLELNVALALVPGLIVATAAGFALAGGLGLVLVLKGADGTLRHSLYRTGTELLFVPISEELRSRVKGLIDVLGQRGGQALGSILILMTLSASVRESTYALLACAAGGLWLLLALDLKRDYLGLLRETLSQEGEQRSREFPALDMASLETLLATLNAPDDRQVMAALEILYAEGKVGVVPALLLYHPSPPVVIRALELFADSGRTDFLAVAERLLAHPDPRVRGASLRVLAALRPEERILRSALEDPAAEVRHTAGVALVALGLSPEGGVPDHGPDSIAKEEPEVRLSLARAVRAHPSAAFDGLLESLLRDPELEVRREAVRAVGAARNPVFLPSLLALLGERPLREEARASIGAFGPVGLARLEEALGNPQLPHAIRRQLPLTIGRFASPRAASILLTHLLDEKDGMIRFKILRALGRWRNNQPHLPLDVGVLERSLHHTLSAGFRFKRWRRALEAGAIAEPRRATEVHRILILLLSDKQDHALERLFRLLNLHTGNDEFRRIFRGLHAARREARASSRELLESLLFPPLKQPLLSLVDDLLEPPEAFGDPGTGPPWEESPGYDTDLGELLDSGVETLSSLAAAQLAILRLPGAEDRLERCRPLSEEHRRVLRRSLAEIVGGTSDGGESGGG